MNADYKNFIATYSDVYPEGYCQHLISEFDRLTLAGAGYNRQNGEGAPKHRKNDFQINLNIGVHSVTAFNGHPTSEVFFQGLQRCYDHYANEYAVLRDSKINGSAMKMQRTDPGGGYHLWHAEQGNGEFSERVLVYMLYLNTLEQDEGGETEFLYQRTRYKPQENMMVVWPAAFTHTHRGNTVLGEKSKYIVTGWFYYE